MNAQGDSVACPGFQKNISSITVKVFTFPLLSYFILPFPGNFFL